jgi:hypothetical protein
VADRGEPRVCSMVVPPGPEDEERRRLVRERKMLVAERTRETNRIRGLLASQGVTDYDPLRRDRRARLGGLRTGDGRALPVSKKLANLPDASLFARRETIRNDPKMLIGVARAVDKGYYFNMANLTAAVKITWKLYPEAEPKNMPPDKALAGGIFVNQERMKIWRSPATGPGRDGLFLAPQWRDFVAFMLQQKLLAQPVPLDRIYTNALIPQINKFDRATVRAQAKAFDLGRLK